MLLYITEALLSILLVLACSPCPLLIVLFIFPLPGETDVGVYTCNFTLANEQKFGHTVTLNGKWSPPQSDWHIVSLPLSLSFSNLQA